MILHWYRSFVGGLFCIAFHSIAVEYERDMRLYRTPTMVKKRLKKEVLLVARYSSIWHCRVCYNARKVNGNLNKDRDIDAKMTAKESTAALTGAEQVVWDLSDLYIGTDDPQIDHDIQAIHAHAAKFVTTYRGRIAELDAGALNAALEAYEHINEMAEKLSSFAHLGWSTDSTDTNWGRLVSRTDQVVAEVGQQLVFLQLEWLKLPEDHRQALIKDPMLTTYKHLLEVMQLTEMHVLTEGEEKVASELTLSGINGWRRYFGEVMSAQRYELDGEHLTMSQILEHVRGSDRDLRRRASDNFTAGLHQSLHTSTFVINMMARYRQSMDKLRGYPHWLRYRNIANQTDDRTVEVLIESVTSRYDVVARYYQLMQRVLGYDELYEYDRYAPITNDDTTVQWADAKDMVLTAFDRFHPQMATVAGEFFDKSWIHAALQPNKRGGAYSASTVASAHPYILMNYAGSLNNVMTLAHELGHGIHQYLSRSVGNLQQSTPLTTAEMASTFAEMLVFDALMNQIDDPMQRLALRVDKIGDTFATVYRQVAMNRFEDRLHNAVRENGELTTDDLSTLWMETQQPMFGDSVTLRDEYRVWWSYIPHFIDVPGYVYAYSFGELLVWSIYSEYQRQGPDFAGKYVEALGKGGSVWPEELVSPLGIDLRDEHFWHQGLNLIEDMVVEAEAEVDRLKL